MKKSTFRQLPQAVYQLDKKLTNIERLLLEKSNEPQPLHKRTLVNKTLYYSNIAIKIITSVIDCIVKLVDAYSKIA